MPGALGSCSLPSPIVPRGLLTPTLPSSTQGPVTLPHQEIWGPGPPPSNTHRPGGLGSCTSHIIMHIPGGLVPIYLPRARGSRSPPTPTYPGVWCPSTWGSGILFISSLHPHTWGSGVLLIPIQAQHSQGSGAHLLGIWGPGHLILAPTYPVLWCPHTQRSGVPLPSTQHPHTPHIQCPPSPPHTALTG